jgi:glycosyltransferase involved in cell wall biosynthesis
MNTLSVLIPLGGKAAVQFLPFLAMQLKKLPKKREIIVCTELPLQLCKRYLPDDTIYIVSDANIGTKRNLLNDAASGDYIFCMDADDFYCKYRFDMQAQALLKHKVKITTTDRILCWDLKSNKWFWNKSASESGLCYTNEIAKTRKFANTQTREGNAIASGEDVLMVNDIVYLVALSHGGNTGSRIGEEVKDASMITEIMETFSEEEMEFINKTMYRLNRPKGA